MVVGIMPITGIPLPFVSHGGASLISLAVGLGILRSMDIRQTRRGGSGPGPPQRLNRPVGRPRPRLSFAAPGPPQDLVDLVPVGPPD